MDTPVLSNKDVYPGDEVLNSVLGKTFPAYKEFISAVTGKEYGLEPVWNYYNDGKSWLCKVIYKKKTVFWLSVWEGNFKTAFYFTDKTKNGIFDLPIAEEIKEDFKTRAYIGKLIPLVISVTKKKQLKDILAVIEYKVKLK